MFSPFLSSPPTPVAQTLRTTVNKWDYLNLRSFCKGKDTDNKTKRQPTDLEKLFTNSTSDRALISKVYKKLKKIENKILDNQLKNGVQN